MKYRPKRNVWDRGAREPLPVTPRQNELQRLAKQKVLTVQEAATYLRVNKSMIERFIKRGVLEVIPTESRTRLISLECLRGLITPVKSLNARLKMLDELKAEVDKKIKRKQEQLKNLDK